MAAELRNKGFGREAKLSDLSFLKSCRSTPHPGAFLDSRFLQPLSISQAHLARALGISRRRVNELVVGKRSITPSTAIKLTRFFNTDPEFWLTLQMHWDLYQELEKEKRQSLPAQ